MSTINLAAIPDNMREAIEAALSMSPAAERLYRAGRLSAAINLLREEAAAKVTETERLTAAIAVANTAASVLRTGAGILDLYIPNGGDGAPKETAAA